MACAFRKKGDMKRDSRHSETVLPLADWYRLPDGRLCRALTFTLWEGGALIDVWMRDGAILSVAWKLGENPKLNPVVAARAGEWWRFRSCADHGRLNKIGEIPFAIPDVWGFSGKHNEELVSCGCLVPDDTGLDLP